MKIRWGEKKMGIMSSRGVFVERGRYYSASMAIFRLWGITFNKLFVGVMTRTNYRAAGSRVDHE